MGDTRSFDDLVTEVTNLRADFEDFKTTAMGRFPSFDRAVGQPLRLTGAAEPTRFVGRTTSGAPSSGTFEVGDFAFGSSGQLYVCQTAGSPGSWTGHGVLGLATESADTNTTATTKNGATSILTLSNVSVYAGRSYFVGLSRVGFFMTNLTSNGVMAAQLTYTTNGTSPTASSTLLARHLVYCLSPALSNQSAFFTIYRPGTSHTLNLLLSCYRAVSAGSSTGTFYASDDPCDLIVCDLGD